MKVREYCPELLQEATKVRDKYIQVLTLFRNCHHLYNSNTVTECDISMLGKTDAYTTSCPRLYLSWCSRRFHQRIHDILPGNVPTCVSDSKDALSRGAHAALALASEVESCIWDDGRARLRVYTCSLQQHLGRIPQHAQPCGATQEHHD